MKAKPTILEVGENPPSGVGFWCPGCQEMHHVSVRPGAWTWNGDEERPTINPSVKVEYDKVTPEGYAMIARGEPPNIPEEIAGIVRMKYPTIAWCCHSVVTDGTIRFERDTTHELVNQAVPLPDIPGRAI